MSGAGRKHRAKHLTQQYLDSTGWVGPKEGETLAVCLESPRGQHVRVLLLLAGPSAVSDGADESGNDVAGPSKEQLAFLPGKFHKVIWLSIKDIVVVSDGTVTFKPSPEQMAIFLRDPTNAGWPERIAAAQQQAEEQRVAVQRMPQYGATTQTTTSVLTGPQVQRDVRAEHGAEGALLGEESGEDGAEEEELVNPNWQNIKHHQQFFYGVDDDSDEEGEEDEEEEEEKA